MTIARIAAPLQNLARGESKIRVCMVIFFVGILTGLAVQPDARAQSAPNRPSWLVAINHVGLMTDDLEKTAKFYRDTFGLTEGIPLRDNPQGPAVLHFLQFSSETFLELQRADARRPAGTFDHIALEVNDMAAAISALRQRGLKVEDRREGRTLSGLSNVYGPHGERIELIDIGPKSALRRAANSWSGR